MDRLNKVLNLYKLPILLSFIGLVLIIGGLSLSGSKPVTKSQVFPKESLISESKGISGACCFAIKVDISGAVIMPDVYSLSSEDRVEDVIKLAGGFSSEVNTEFVAKKLNLSQKISDGMKIYIPFKGESGGVMGASSTGGAGSGTSINNSTSSELEALPGIGPVTAGKIINGRPYQDINELLYKKVVSKSVFEKIKDLVELN